MTLPADDFTTDADGWTYLAGARFVEPYEWSETSPDYIDPQSRLQPLREGLVLAADHEGLLLNFQNDEFHKGPLIDAMPERRDVWDWPLTYDEFVALPLAELMSELVVAGLLAVRRSGELVDYRLTLPASEESDVSDEQGTSETCLPGRSNVDLGGGKKFMFEGIQLFRKGPLVDPCVKLDFWATRDDLVVSYGVLLTDEQVGSLIEALSQAREDARRLADGEGQRISDGVDYARFDSEPPF
ncbi:hypothetical protein [Micromonospora okii]|uniref:hypothetical protein n=1 Tax=Micromonospora okii TaxID=1182970 RepID=UPI001E52B12C|nr:hypothetical protein [Micromonospora okii]